MHIETVLRMLSRFIQFKTLLHLFGASMSELLPSQLNVNFVCQWTARYYYY